MLATKGQKFESLEAFYADDSIELDGMPIGGRRAMSGEVDCGVHWTESGSYRQPGGRVAWVEATGEIYIAHADGIVEVLGVHQAQLHEQGNRYRELEGPGKPLQDWVALHPDLRALRVQLHARCA
jgi:hypothetical protein